MGREGGLFAVGKGGVGGDVLPAKGSLVEGGLWAGCEP